MLPVADYILLPWPSTAGSQASLANTSNQVALIRVYMPSAITVSLITFSVLSSDAGKFWGVGLYDLDGNLILDSGPVVMPASPLINQMLHSSISPVTIGSGIYWMASSTNSPSSTLRSVSTPSASTNLLNDGVAILGAAANPSVAGQLPATTGAITTPPITGNNIAPLIKLQA